MSPPPRSFRPLLRLSLPPPISLQAEAPPTPFAERIYVEFFFALLPLSFSRIAGRTLSFFCSSTRPPFFLLGLPDLGDCFTSLLAIVGLYPFLKSSFSFLQRCAGLSAPISGARFALKQKIAWPPLFFFISPPPPPKPKKEIKPSRTVLPFLPTAAPFFSRQGFLTVFSCGRAGILWFFSSTAGFRLSLLGRASIMILLFPVKVLTFFLFFSSYYDVARTQAVVPGDEGQPRTKVFFLF